MKKTHISFTPLSYSQSILILEKSDTFFPKQVKEEL